MGLGQGIWGLCRGPDPQYKGSENRADRGWDNGVINKEVLASFPASRRPSSGCSEEGAAIVSTTPASSVLGSGCVGATLFLCHRRT